MIDNAYIFSKQIGNLKQVRSLYFLHWTFVRVTLLIQVGNLLISSLKAELNPICLLLALLGAAPILHVSKIKVKLNFLLLTLVF